MWDEKNVSLSSRGQQDNIEVPKAVAIQLAPNGCPDIKAEYQSCDMLVSQYNFTPHLRPYCPPND
jgi:hypothetical protein